MRIAKSAIVAMMGVVFGLAGCADKGLRQLTSNSQGPDEFMLLPVKPLSVPDSYAILPAPTPGGANLVDPNPVNDAIVALGGRVSETTPGAIPSSDSALVAASSRYGVEPNIRQALDESDAAFRKRQGRATRLRLFRVDRYSQVYRKQSLDPFAVEDGFTRAGIATPSAPPLYD